MVPSDPSNNDQSDHDNRAAAGRQLRGISAGTLRGDVDVHSLVGPQRVLGDQTVLIEPQKTRDRANESAIEDAAGKLLPLIFFNCFQETRADARGGGNFFQRNAAHFAFAL